MKVHAAGADMAIVTYRSTDKGTYDGHDLMPLLRGTVAVSPRKEFFYCRGRVMEGVRAGSWKYRLAKTMISEGKESETAPVPELFHLDWDPAEQYNMFARNREIGDRLAERMKQFAGEIQAQLA